MDGIGDLDIQITDMGYDQKDMDFINSDLGAMNDAYFSDDISDAVETQRAENEEHAGELDQSAAPVGDALGFKRVTVMQSREIRFYMARIEAETGAAGPAALLDFFTKHLGKSS